MTLGHLNIGKYKCKYGRFDGDVNAKTEDD